MAGENPLFVSAVHYLNCCGTGEHYGRIEAHHAGRRPGLGRRAHDETCIPLCTQHHRQWHDGSGPFRGWTREQRATWSDARIAETRTLVARYATPGGAAAEWW